MQLGKAIKVARVQRGLKQAELAEKLGVSATYVSLIEGNKRDPSWSFVNRLASALEIPLPLLLLLAEEADGGARPGEGVRGVIANELLALVMGRGESDGGRSAKRKKKK